MNEMWKSALWKQFGASIDALGNAIDACPEELWKDEKVEFWYIAYHALFWLDLYLDGGVKGFKPPSPFDLGELDPAGVMPERVFEKTELIKYLNYCRNKCKEMLDSISDEDLLEECGIGSGRGTFAELCLYNMRHVQHHAAQLNLLLRQNIDSSPNWVSQAE